VTALPYDPRHRYTAAEFAALPEDTSAIYELQEGVIVMSPRPARDHMKVLLELAVQIREQLPVTLQVLIEVDVDLELDPPVVRVPDLVVTNHPLKDAAPVTKASDVVLAVEIISPGSVRTDTRFKPIEYADAGIPHLWLVDPQPPVTVTAYRLAGDHYEESQRAEHALVTAEPCELHVDLDFLLG
jgi:Uma2 family endonuclease